jgi:hypothetical protein
MAVDRSTLKIEFGSGTLTADKFDALIDSCLNTFEDGLQQLYEKQDPAGDAGGVIVLNTTYGELDVSGDQNITFSAVDGGTVTLSVGIDTAIPQASISANNSAGPGTTAIVRVRPSNVVVDSDVGGATTISGDDSLRLLSGDGVQVLDYAGTAAQNILIDDPTLDDHGATKRYVDSKLLEDFNSAAATGTYTIDVDGTGDVTLNPVGVGTGDVVTSATPGNNDDKVAVFTGGDEFHIKETNVQIDVAGNMTSVGTINTIDITALDASVTTNTADIATLNTNGISNLGGFTLAELNAAITDGDVDDDACCRPPCGVAGGDLSDNYPDPKVVAITEQDATPGDGLGNRYPIGEVDPGTYLYVNPVTNVLEGRSLTSITGSVQATTDPQKDSSIVIWTPGTDGEIDQTCITITGDDAGANKIMTFESGSIGSPDPGSIWYEDNVFNMKLDQADPVLQVGQENWILFYRLVKKIGQE